MPICYQGSVWDFSFVLVTLSYVISIQAVSLKHYAYFGKVDIIPIAVENQECFKSLVKTST